MTLLHDPQKKVESIFREIEKGITHEGDTSYLMELLGNQPSMVHEVILSLSSIMSMDDPKSFTSACLVLNRIVENFPDEVSESLENIMERLSERKKGLNEYEWIPVLELFTRINEEHPESMRTAVPSLLAALGDSNRTVRESAYILLASIAGKNPDFFKYSASELIKNLNGLNIDERLYACRIVGLVAAINPRILEKTFDVIEDFSLNHPDSDLRSEAGLVASLFKPMTNTAQQPESKVPLVRQDDKGSELKGIMNEIAPQINEKISESAGPINEIVPESNKIVSGKGIGEKDSDKISDALQTMIPGRVIESATLIGRSGRIIAQSGPQMDYTLLGKLISIMSFDSENHSDRISIEQTGKKIVAVGVGNKAMLVVATGADTSMGMLLIILNKSVEKLNGILLDSGFT